MDTLTSFSVIVLAALIQASFQLGVSMVTLLSSHTVGKKMSANRMLRLVGSFLAGTLTMTTLLISAFAYIAFLLFRYQTPQIVWSLLAGLLAGVGLAVWVFYYRRGDGTSLWLPRGLARFLDDRVKKTQLAGEAFSLGLTSVIAELLFAASPAAAAALACVMLPTRLQIVALLTYVAISSLGMIIVTVLIGSGHRLSQIQRWREANKRFLQFAAGGGLLILGFYLYANQVAGASALMAGGF